MTTTCQLTTPASSAPRAAVTVRIVKVGKTVLAALRAWMRRRELMAAVAGMDEHMLRDIGVTGQDISAALSVPLWEDPTAHLAQLAAERKAAALAARRRPVL